MEPFKLTVWASQRVAYEVFYNSYEAFLVDCLKLGMGLSRLRTTEKKAFNDALRNGLGQDISGPCWQHGEINLARLVRHALSHNAGRMTEDLKNLRQPEHGIELIGEILQITPKDNHRMLRGLRKAVDKVIEVVCTNPKFMTISGELLMPKEKE